MPPIGASAPSSPAPTPMPSPMKESASRSRRESVFGVGVTIEGKIEGDTDVRITGKFKGDIHIKGDLVVEKGAHVTAKVSAVNVTLGGELNGNIIGAGQVKFLESGQMVGDLKASSLTVAAGSRMRGHVEFGWGAEVTKSTHANSHDHEKKRTEG
jgi:cytoskeletal protein CcmA (bactofilin family)